MKVTQNKQLRGSFRAFVTSHNFAYCFIFCIYDHVFNIVVNISDSTLHF